MTTVLITGANRGIGLEHVRRFLAAGATVHAGVRVPSEAEDLHALQGEHKGKLHLHAYDAADASAPSALSNALNGETLDILLNNAGIYGGDAQTFADVDEAAFLNTVRINTLAPLQLSRALADNVAKGGRKIIANQSSRMGSIGENASGGFYAYRTSKAGLNMVTQSLAQDLRAKGITVIAMHPGWVKTRMGGPSAPVSVTECVDGQQKILERLTLADTGRFFDFSGDSIAW
jgi:NAD(P)-dependent dehydrogenase (short-subunit alcohol dehydrogenase family)